MNASTARTLVETLTSFFSTHCKVHPSDIHNQAVPIEIPLSRYDDQNIMLFVEQAGDQTILHDGGDLTNYLADHEIVVHSKAKKYAIYNRFYEDLAQKHGFAFSEKQRRFEMRINPTEGQKALVFVECLISLSFLVMTKSAGLKTFSSEDLQRLSVLKTTLEMAIPGIRVGQSLLPEARERAAPQTWGLTLSVPQAKTRGCVHYLRGPDWTHLLRGAIVLNTFAHMSQKWFNTKPECFWGVYGGPTELFNDTRAILKDLGNGHTPRLILFNDREQLVDEVSERMGVPAREDWRQFLKHRQQAVGERLLNTRTQQADAPVQPQASEAQSDTLWGQPSIERDPVETAMSASFDASVHRLLSETDYKTEFTAEPLDTYGLAFAKYVMSEIKDRPDNIRVSRFNQIADDFFEYFRNDARATGIIDGEVAEIEALLKRSTAPEDVFREEEQLANRYMLTELRSLKSELAKFLETKNGR